ncbi:hypothetical protein GH714_040272 [Hevea brasiliensis]|uniref:Uncharacterized protein n=1 Tax=Hevea brasiliensis TaxID=3981 RepID=A0A6A6MRV5_HEVBR|nr:hypothetical protein GH714_040272 [Hevea brasiliensis]
MDYVPFSVTKNLSELNDRRCKGLCLWCDEQFTSSHNCDKASFMVSIINDILDEEGDDENKEELREIQENVSAIEDTVQQDWPSTVVNGNVQQEYPPILQPLECSKWDKEDQESENSTFSLLQISLSDDQNFLQMEDHATMPVLFVGLIRGAHEGQELENGFSSHSCAVDSSFHLLKNVLDSFVGIEMDAMDRYEQHFEVYMLQDTGLYYFLAFFFANLFSSCNSSVFSFLSRSILF